MRCQLAELKAKFKIPIILKSSLGRISANSTNRPGEFRATIDDNRQSLQGYQETKRLTKSETRPIKIKIVATLVFFLITRGFGRALSPSDYFKSYARKQWTSLHGLPQNSIQSIYQTQDGYLWLGTENGLARFNGSRFQCFNNENTPSFMNNSVRVIREDRYGTLWIGTEGGLIQYRDGTFKEVSDIPGSPNLVVCDICEDRDENLWFATDKGLSRYRKGSFESLTKSDGLPEEIFLFLMVDKCGNLWAGTVDGWLIRFEADSLKEPFMERMKYTYRKFPSGVAAICEDGEGNIFGVREEDVFVVSGGDIQNIKIVKTFPGKQLLTMIRDMEGNLIIGSANGGLIRMQSRPQYEHDIDTRFSEDYIIRLYFDRDSELWVGTRGSGLFRLSNTVIKMFTKNEGLSNDFIRFVYEDLKGRLWVGTNKGLNYFDQGNFTQKGQELFQPYIVKSLIMDRSQSLWVATANHGLFYVPEGQTGNPVSLGIDSASINISCLDLDRSGTLWVGTSMNGLFSYQKGRISHYSKEKGLKSDIIGCLHEDRDGYLWVGTAYGVNLIKEGKIFNLPDQLNISCFVSAFYEDEEGRMWMATVGKGLMLLDKNRLESFTLEDGLYSNSIYAILEDEHQRFWMSCEKGIFFVSKKELMDYGNHKIPQIRYWALNESEGLISSGVGPAGGHSFATKTRDGRLWFSTVKGLAMIDPNTQFNRRHFKSALIKSLSVNDRSIVPSREHVFPPRTKKIDFLLDIINFKDYDNTRIRYRLSGLEEKWTEMRGDMEMVVRYSRLSKGTYQFELEILDSDDEWTDCCFPVIIRILPHFYHTAWFYILVAIFLACAAFIGSKAKKRLQIRRMLKKYKSAKLTPNKSEAYLKTIVDLLEKESLFKNKDLNLPKLAEKASIPSAFISQIINTRLKMNFYDFLNMHRVEYVKKSLLSQDKIHLKIEAIGLEAGFKSKASFFRAFKKFTGMTPSEFKKNHSHFE